MNDNRQFSKTVEHFLSDEGSQCSQINLVDQDNTILYDKSLSKEFSNFFDTAVKNLYVKGPQVSHVKENSDLIDIALNKYDDHPSIFKIHYRNNGKTNYRPHKPISLPLLCGYRKIFITQTALLYFIEKWNFMLDAKEYVGVILIDLSKNLFLAN